VGGGGSGSGHGPQSDAGAQGLDLVAVVGPELLVVRCQDRQVLRIDDALDHGRRWGGGGKGASRGRFAIADSQGQQAGGANPKHQPTHADPFT
jgi:hypothetical protein